MAQEQQQKKGSAEHQQKLFSQQHHQAYTFGLLSVKIHNHNSIMSIQSLADHSVKWAQIRGGDGHLWVTGLRLCEFRDCVCLCLCMRAPMSSVSSLRWFLLRFDDAISLSPCYHTLLTPATNATSIAVLLPVSLPLATLLSCASSVSLPGACPLHLTSSSVARAAVK